MRTVLGFVLICLSVSLCLGQCCSGGVPMSGNIGLPASSKGTIQFTLNYDLNVLETLKSGTAVLDDRTRRRETHAVLFESGYSITDKWSVDLFLPFVRQERTINQPNLVEDFVATQGLGDAVVLVKHAVTAKVTLGIGVKLPTGASDRTRENGLPLNADLQPGSGALDQLLYANYRTNIGSRPSMTFSGTLIHRFTGSNNSYLGSSTYEFGNETQVVTALADRVVLGPLLLDPSIKVRFRIQGRDQFNGIDFPSSGGAFVFVNPGISAAINPDLSFQFNMSLPVYANVNDTQLSPTYRINTGLYLTIRKKESSESTIPNFN